MNRGTIDGLVEDLGQQLGYDIIPTIIIIKDKVDPELETGANSWHRWFLVDGRWQYTGPMFGDLGQVSQAINNSEVGHASRTED